MAFGACRDSMTDRCMGRLLLRCRRGGNSRWGPTLAGLGDRDALRLGDALVRVRPPIAAADRNPVRRARPVLRDALLRGAATALGTVEARRARVPRSVGTRSRVTARQQGEKDRTRRE